MAVGAERDVRTGSDAGAPAPGSGSPRGRRWRPRRRPWRYELLVCGVAGHSLVGLDVTTITADDALLVREAGDGTDTQRWHRCLRCDSWVVLAPPAAPQRDRVPPRAEIELPLRGRPLRDRVVLRLIAVDRALHVLVLALAAVAVFVFLADRAAWRADVLPILEVLGPLGPLGLRPDGLVGGLLGEVGRAFTVPTRDLALLGTAIAAYAVLEAVEAVGLWTARRWAEYLTFVATTVLLVPEIYELAERVTVIRVGLLLLNVVIVVYLLRAKRLFGLRGGGRAEAAEREHDSGWPALERAGP